jgi:nucleoside-diphosphate-sugar epimerase
MPAAFQARARPPADAEGRPAGCRDGTPKLSADRGGRAADQPLESARTPMPSDQRIVITGAAGLIGQNLIARLARRGVHSIVGIDKHPANTATLARLHPAITVIEADLAQRGAWEDAFQGGGTLILAHAQIGGEDAAAFDANNITATEHVLAAAQRGGVDHIVHISSSVVNSAAHDFYTETKKAQEKLVAACPVPNIILRPTLMFGWFDRKHLGWLARFMRRTPVFPIPGSGRYARQPLYAGDFCDIILACVQQRLVMPPQNISGREVIDYIDLIRAVRQASGAHSAIVRTPFPLFWLMLKTYALFDRNPPFTTRQLAALAIPELFEIIDWPAIFGVPATPLPAALEETFRGKTYCDVALEF